MKCNQYNYDNKKCNLNLFLTLQSNKKNEWKNLRYTCLDGHITYYSFASLNDTEKSNFCHELSKEYNRSLIKQKSSVANTY